VQVLKPPYFDFPEMKSNIFSGLAVHASHMKQAAMIKIPELA